MKKLFLLFAVSALLVLGAGCWTTTSNTPSGSNNASASNANTDSLFVNAANQPSEVAVTLQIDKGDASPVRSFTDAVPSGTTALALLQKVAAANAISLDVKQYDFGAMISGIGGLESTSKAYWLFYVNGKEAPVGAGEYLVQDKDTIQFRFTQSSASSTNNG